MEEDSRMRTLVLLIAALPPALATAQDAGSAKLRELTRAAPIMTMERLELRLEPALEIEQVSAVAADRDGRLYLLQRGKESDPIIVADSAGNVLRSFGRGLFNRPHSIRIDPDGNVWTVDSNTSSVYKFSPSGEQLLALNVGGLWLDPPSESCAASDIAFAANGDFYVADGYCNARIIQYDAAGQKIREWGQAGTGPGEFDLPHSLAVSPEGDVYVADRENGRVQWFTPDGKYLGEWAFGGRVLSVVFSADGELFVSAEPKDAVPQQEASLLHVSRPDGGLLGRIDDFGHELATGPDGSLLPGSLTERVTIYRPAH
jgi:DNA-binding beta-propeller fold protein YncE